MRVVADTNIVVSGLLWDGRPRQILELAREQTITLLTTAFLLGEMQAVLMREKFVRRLTLAGVTYHELVSGYAALSTIVEPASIEPVILEDPDDDEVLACAVAAHAQVIVSGDSHLLDLKRYRYIDIFSAAEFLDNINNR